MLKRVEGLELERGEVANVLAVIHMAIVEKKTERRRPNSP
jgi:hypothetical protein